MARVGRGASDHVVLAFVAEQVVRARVALDVVLAALAHDAVAGSGRAAVRVVQVGQLVVVLVTVRELLAAGDRARAGPPVASGSSTDRRAVLPAVRVGGSGVRLAVVLAEQDVVAAVAVDRVGSALARIGVAETGSAPPTMRTSNRNTSRSCAAGSVSRPWRATSAGPSERPLDPGVVARDHVAVAASRRRCRRRSCRRRRERLAAPVVVERAVAVRVEECRWTGGLAEPPPAMSSSTGAAADDVATAVALDVVVATGVARIEAVHVGVVAADRVRTALTEEDVLTRPRR